MGARCRPGRSFHRGACARVSRHTISQPAAASAGNAKQTQVTPSRKARKRKARKAARRQAAALSAIARRKRLDAETQQMLLESDADADAAELARGAAAAERQLAKLHLAERRCAKLHLEQIAVQNGDAMPIFELLRKALLHVQSLSDKQLLQVLGEEPVDVNARQGHLSYTAADVAELHVARDAQLERAVQLEEGKYLYQSSTFDIACNAILSGETAGKNDIKLLAASPSFGSPFAHPNSSDAPLSPDQSASSGLSHSSHADGAPSPDMDWLDASSATECIGTGWLGASGATDDTGWLGASGATATGAPATIAHSSRPCVRRAALISCPWAMGSKQFALHDIEHAGFCCAQSIIDNRM